MVILSIKQINYNPSIRACVPNWWGTDYLPLVPVFIPLEALDFTDFLLMKSSPSRRWDCSPWFDPSNYVKQPKTDLDNTDCHFIKREWEKRWKLLQTGPKNWHACCCMLASPHVADVSLKLLQTSVFSQNCSCPFLLRAFCSDTKLDL